MFVHGIGKTLYAVGQINIQVLRLLKVQTNVPHRAKRLGRFAARQPLLIVGVRSRFGLVTLLETFGIYVGQSNVCVSLQICDQIANL